MKLEDEIRGRTQGYDENISIFIWKLRLIMEKVEPPMSLEQQFNRTYRHMCPDYVDKIGRQQFTIFEELLVLGRNEKMKKEQRRSYKPSPHPEQSLLSDAAYRGRKPSNNADSLAK